jgi:hypothetical protein
VSSVFFSDLQGAAQAPVSLFRGSFTVLYEHGGGKIALNVQE